MPDDFFLKSPLSLEALLSSLGPGGRVLDLGCGGGTFRYTAFPGLQIHAFDEGVHEKVRGFPSNAHFAQAGASAIPAGNAVFDLIVVNFAFEHFPDPVAGLKEITRVARDRAYVWISVPNAGSFEDQLYRNLFAGGGHLQSLTLERFLRMVYEHTCLKLTGFMELPAGFTFLGESEELRHLTWAVIDALKRTVAIDAPGQSGYIFVLRKLAEAGTGFREYIRTCHACGSPDGVKSAMEDPEKDGGFEPWTCERCGAHNPRPSTLQEIRLDAVEKAQRRQWERFPETHPARLRELADERGRWGLELERELAALRASHSELQTQFDQRGQWALGLDAQIKQLGAEIARLQRPGGYLRHLWKKLRHRLD